MTERLRNNVSTDNASGKFVENFYKITEKGLKELEYSKFYFHCKDTKYCLNDNDIINALQKYNLYSYSEGDEFLYKEIIWVILNDKYKEANKLGDITDVARDIGDMLHKDELHEEALYYFTKAIMASIEYGYGYSVNVLSKIFKIMKNINMTADDYFKFLDSFVANNRTFYCSPSNIRRYKEDFLFRYEKQFNSVRRKYI